MKKSGIIAMLVVLLTMVTLTVSYAGTKTVTLKLGHVGPAKADHPWQKYTLKYASEVEKATQGRVIVKSYPASQLGGDREITESIQNGSGDMGLVSTIAMGNFVPELELWDLPYIWPTDNAKVDKILEDSPIKDRLVAAAAKKRINIIAFWENDWRGMTSSKKAITMPADFKGQKIRVVENRPSMDYFKRVGAIPTPMSWAETYTALQQGTVDAQDNGAVIDYGVKIWDVQKFFTDTKHIYCPMGIIISDAALAKVSDADRTILKKLAIEIGREQRNYCREMSAKYAAEMASKMQVYQLTPEGLKAFQESAKPTYAALQGSIGKEFIDMMLKYRE